MSQEPYQTRKYRKDFDLSAVAEGKRHAKELAAALATAQREKARAEAAEAEVAKWQAGPVTESMLRARDGYIHLGNDCEIAAMGTTMQFYAARQSRARLVRLVHERVQDLGRKIAGLEHYFEPRDIKTKLIASQRDALRGEVAKLRDTIVQWQGSAALFVCNCGTGGISNPNEHKEFCLYVACFDTATRRAASAAFADADKGAE